MARTHIILGNDATTQNLFAIENQSASRVNVNIRSINISVDDIVVLAAVTPLIRISRATAISGGQLVEKTGLDTTQSSDSNVVFRAALLEMARITATPGTTIWEKFDNRMHTAVEQQRPNIGKNILPYIVGKTGMEFKLRPSEEVLVQVVAAAGTSNSAVANNYFVECMFEEEALSTFSISGIITLNASPVVGAKVIVIQADDISLTNPILVGVITTPIDGTWSSSIVSGKIGAAFVQYTTGGIYYTAQGSPFLSE
jgi:plastocyanin